MGVPSLVILKPTLIAVIRQPHSFGQLFADVTSGVSVGSGVTGANGASGCSLFRCFFRERALAVRLPSFASTLIPSARCINSYISRTVFGLVVGFYCISYCYWCLALALLCSVVTLCIPQCVKPSSRSMWIGILHWHSF